MKKIVLILTLVMFLGSTLVLAQPLGKKWELGVSLAYTNYKFSGGLGSEYLLNIPIRVGYFFWKGLEAEPEITLTKFKGDDTSYILCTNFSYNFKASASVKPFILAGVGFGNGVPVAHLVEGSSDTNAFIINAGAGLKYLIGNSAAIRLEYRYTRDRLSYPDYEEKENLNLHQLFIGVSLFF